MINFGGLHFLLPVLASPKLKFTLDVAKLWGEGYVIGSIIPESKILNEKTAIAV